MSQAAAPSYGYTEILQIADAVSREKGLDKESIIDAMEQAIQVAGRRKYGYEQNIRAEIDRKTGQIQLFRVRTVVDPVQQAAEIEAAAAAAAEAENNNNYSNNNDKDRYSDGDHRGEKRADVKHEQFYISLEDAKKIDDSLELGDEIKDPLPPIDFGRVAAQTAKQVILQKVRDAEREKQYEEFKDKVGQIISGTVKRVEYGNVVVDFGRTEAVIRRDELIPRETFRTGERIRAHIFSVSREKSGPQILLSRVRNEFMAKLFEQEVPEIYNGIVEIRAVSRDPGSRAKIAVISNDPTVNPVLSCIGVRGSRVQAVVQECQGERVDIIEWSEEPANFVVNAISSAEVSKVVLDEDTQRVEIVVPDEQQSMAIGRRGQNVRLASQLTGWNIDIMTEETESERRAEEFGNISGLFIEALDVEEVIAHLLVAEGFTSIEEVAYIPLDDLSGIEGFDETVAEELQRRAKTWLEKKEVEQQEKLKALGVTKELIDFEGLTADMLVKLGEGEIKTGDDFAGLANDELMEMTPEAGLTEEQANELIMRAREQFFD